MKLTIICGLVLAIAWALTLLARRYALLFKVMDIPTQRSSHAVPTPRGGGVALVLAFFVGTAALAVSFGGYEGEWLLLGCSGIVALIGWLDDHVHLNAGWRIACHFAASALALKSIGGMPTIALWGITIGPGLLGNLLGILYLVWMLNLYNFMDGIDGLAGAEAFVVSAVGGLMLWQLGAATTVVLWLWVLMSAVLGFLLWNLPPARIFMGDVGSGFLGFLFGVVSLKTAVDAPQLFWPWVIMLGVFVVDATVTLMRRLARGERVYEAHRSHAYQVASKRFRSHGAVTLGVVALTIVWLCPWAWAAASGAVDGFSALLLSYAPIVILALHFRAGGAAQE